MTRVVGGSLSAAFGLGPALLALRPALAHEMSCAEYLAADAQMAAAIDVKMRASRKADPKASLTEAAAKAMR